MARPNTIDKMNLGAEVLELSLTMSSREIAEELAKRHGVKISHVAVARYIQGVRRERAEATKALVQETIKRSVPRDLEILEELVAKEREWFLNSEDLSVPDKLLVAKELRQTIDIKLKYSGAGEPSSAESWEERVRRARAERGFEDDG